MDIRERHGRRFILLRHTHRSHKVPYLICASRSGKPRAAIAQSFTLWQQATIEITCHDHSHIACSRHMYCIWVLFVAHIPFVNRTFKATSTERLQQHPSFNNEPHRSTFFLRPSHPGHSTTLLTCPWARSPPKSGVGSRYPMAMARRDRDSVAPLRRSSAG